jgi:hypothetical protein
MMGDMVKVALMDILIHGLTNVPYQGIPFTDEAYKKAGVQATKLCGMEDMSKIDINEIVNDPWHDKIPIKDHTVILSVYEMENRPSPPTPSPSDDYRRINLIFQLNAAHDRVKSILITLRAYIYDYVSGIWTTSLREKDRIALLGPDYRFVIDKLDALETPVGSELLASVDNLRDNNPASWKLCALGCRNVVIKLGTLLWHVPGQTYQTQNGTTLDVSNEKEKNKLYAYIDVFLKQASPDEQTILCEAQELVESVYDKGSKGKRQIRYGEAQTLVVDTFRLVGSLNEATELKPIDSLPMK